MLVSKYYENKKILWGDATSLIFAEFTDNKKLLHSLNEKVYFIGKNGDATYRIINHWTGIGLINEERKKGVGWRKFSLVDLVWQRVILELRKFGFPNEKILKTKKCLMDIKNEKGKHYPLFDFYIARALQKNATFLIVFEDGFADLGIDKEIILAEEIGTLNQNFIRINLNDILNKIFVKKDFQPIRDITIPLNKEEKKLIEAVNEGDLKSVEVILNNGKIVLLKKKENPNINTRIIELAKEGKYQKITIHYEGSHKPVSIEREIREKI